MNSSGEQTKTKNVLRPAKNVNADILGPRLVFIICVLALTLFGLVMIFSASNVEAINNNESPFSYVFKQTVFCVVGILCGFAVWRWIPFSWWRGNFLWLCFGVMMCLMLVTLVGGTDILGARRWIRVGPVSLQPSEFVKILLVLIVAKYYSDFRYAKVSFKKFAAISLGVTFGLLGFILVGQSDLGTTAICIIGVLTVLWISNVPKWFFIFLLILCTILGIIFIVTTGYRSNRMVFLDPYNDGAGGYGAGYQLIRSLYALSEGGFGGVGLGNSYEKYQYLPEAETDFIYSIIGEELGFVGCVLVLALFVGFLVSGMFIVQKSKSQFAASISAAFVVMIVFQALLNIACVIGIAPTTGKPLPFISSGGSSLIASLIMVGFVLASSEAEALPDEYEIRRSSFRASASSSVQNEESVKADDLLPQKNPIMKNIPKISFSEIKNSIPKFDDIKSTIVSDKPKFDADIKKNIPKIAVPKFIDRNSKQKQSSQKSVYKKNTSNTFRARTTTQRRPSVKQENLNSKKSYAYRRDKADPSFKPVASTIAPSKDFKKNASKARAVENKQKRKSKKWGK